MTLFILFINITIQADGIIHCVQENTKIEDFGTITGLALSEQSWWYKFKTFLTTVEDVPVQLVSLSKFYKLKSNTEKGKVLQGIRDNCSRIGGIILDESIRDFTKRGPISFAGICIRDKAVLRDKNVNYVIVHSNGYASSGKMKKALISKVNNQCTTEHQGQIVGEVKKVSKYIDNFYYFAGVCKVKAN